MLRDRTIDEMTTRGDLVEIREHGFFTCRIDDDGDIVVRDLINFYIHSAAAGLLLSAPFDFREGVDSEVMRSVACAANAGARMVRFRLGGEDEQFLRAEHYIVMRAGGHAARRYINTIHEQLRGGYREVMA